MKTRRLGCTDLGLSEIGFGAWAIGGGDWQFGWGPQDDREAVAAIRVALDLGVNWIDTAAVYGLGHSEELVAEAVEGRREQVVIASKCSLVWDEHRRISSSLRADSVRRECEASLRRLRTDRIDVYQIHWPNDDARIEEGWRAIGQLIDEGKVRFGGVSNFAVSHMQRAQRIRPIASLQPPYSMLRRRVEDTTFEYCRHENIGVLAYSPLESGILSGSFDIGKLAPNDWRRRNPEYREPALAINLRLVEELRKIAEGYGKTAGQLATAWVLRRSEVTSAIVGARRPEQVRQNLGGAGWCIGESDLAFIDRLLEQREEQLRSAPRA